MGERRVKISVTIPESQARWLRQNKIYRPSKILEVAIARLMEKSR